MAKIPLDPQQVINEIDYYGDSVTVRTITDSSYSKWGDASESTSDEASVKCIINDFTPEELKEVESLFQDAEKRFFFKSTQSNLSNGNRIVFASITYEILRVIQHTAVGSTHSIEVWGKRT